MLSAFVNEERDDWDEHLPYVTMVYRSTVHESIKFSPNRLVLGRETNLPLDIMVGPPPNSKKNSCYGEYVEWLKGTMESSGVEAQNFVKRAALRQKRNYDKTAVPYKFQRGDWVWYFYPPKAKQKLGQGWTGPFLVVGSLNNIVNRIQRTSSEGVKVVHVDNLRKFKPKTLPSSWLERSSSLPPSTDGDQHSGHFSTTKEVDSRGKLEEGPLFILGQQNISTFGGVRHRPAYFNELCS